MAKIVIVAESGGDLLKQDIEKYGIEVVPMHVQMENKTFDDGTFPPAEIFSCYDRTGNLPHTSASSPRDYRQVFDRIKAGNPDAVILHLAYSAVTTASWHNSLLASEGNENIIHIDTKQVSGGMRAVVVKMAQFLQLNPDADTDKIKTRARQLTEKARFVFFPGDMKYLKAGGRVSNSAYLVASMLKLKPLIEMIDGKLTATKKYRGSDARIYPEMLEDTLERYSFDKNSFFMMYSPGLDEKLKKLLENTARKRGYNNITWVRTGCVISTHSGPGAFGVGGLVKNSREVQ